MNEYINELMEEGLSEIIDTQVDKVLCDDELYNEYMDRAEILFNELSRLIEDEELLEAYKVNMMYAQERACVVSYIASVKNTIRFMN